MSLSTSFILGTYLVCKMKKETSEEIERVCEKDPEHELGCNAKFCKHCGGKVINAPQPYDIYVSFVDVLDAVSVSEMSKELREIYQSFFHIPDEYVGFDEEGYELLALTNCLYFNGDNEGMHDVTLDQLAKLQQPPANIDLLQRVIGYESVEVKFGVLVQVA